MAVFRLVEHVKQQAIQMVNRRLGTDQEPSRYLLASLNDANHRIMTEDPDRFKREMAALSASDRGGCTPLSMIALLKGLAFSDERADLFLYLAGPSREADLAGDVIDLAFKKQIKLFLMVSDHCAPIDAVYLRIASETGGQLFLLSSAEAGRTMKLVDRTVRSNSVSLLSIADSLSGAAKSYSVPVDAALARITFSVSGTNNVVVKRADGSTVKTTDRDVETVPLRSGAIFTFTRPAAGEWGIAVNGAGDFSILISGEGTLDLASFRFFEPAGRPGHKGLFPVTGRPLVGRMNIVGASLNEAVSTAVFELRSRSGMVLQALPLLPLLAGVPNEFFGKITVPDTAFLVYLSGLDRNGAPYQRVFPGMIKPQTIQVTPVAGPELQPGEPISFVFRVKNLGPADTFRVTGFDEPALIQHIDPSYLTLGANQGVDVTVQLLLPLNASPDLTSTLILSVEGTGTGDARNFAVATNMAAAITSVSPIEGDSVRWYSMSDVRCRRVCACRDRSGGVRRERDFLCRPRQ